MNALTPEAQLSQHAPLTDSLTEPLSVIAPDGRHFPAAPSQSFDVLLSKFLSTFILSQDWRFYVNEKSIPAEVLSGNKMMLPAILWQAEKTHHLLCGKPMGAKFKSDPEAAVGAIAVVETEAGHARSMYPIFCVEVLVQALEYFTLDDQNSQIGPVEVRENILQGRKLPPRGTACSLDHLVQGFFQDHDLGLVPWTDDSQPQSPNMDGFPVTPAQPRAPVGLASPSVNSGRETPNPGGATA